ncbi:uncharacterized protein LOC143035095 isoform X2 [Oratosquilla oratoria]|uniref:uncharacterized protein LOC143035095 isoform X2 n=1 Tax=Oratosquilla oratoria TaxID=337810 RepID=UPI003F76ACC9
MLLHQHSGVALPWLTTTAFVALALVVAAARVHPSPFSSESSRQQQQQQGALRSFWGRQSVDTRLSGFIITPRLAVSAATSPILSSNVVVPEFVEDDDEDLFVPAENEKMSSLQDLRQSQTSEREDPEPDRLLNHLIQTSLSSPPPRLATTFSQRMTGGRGTSVAMAAAAAAAGVGAAWDPNLDNSLLEEPGNKVTQLNLNEPRAKRDTQTTKKPNTCEFFLIICRPGK